MGGRVWHKNLSFIARWFISLMLRSKRGRGFAYVRIILFGNILRGVLGGKHWPLKHFYHVNFFHRPSTNQKYKIINNKHILSIHTVTYCTTSFEITLVWNIDNIENKLLFSKMMVTPAAEENSTEVRREDQDNINKFARLNARLHELRDERKIIKVS